jgi:DNA-binding response OmpR family regulator
VAAAGEASGAEPAAESAADLAPLILVCESDPEVGEAIGRLLVGEGYRCSCVETMEEARERVRTGPRIDAFIIELAIPAGAGFSLLRWLRSRVDTAGVPVVGVSATVEDGQFALNGEIPLVDWIQKPVHEEQLRSALGALARVLRGSGRVLHVEDDADLRRTVAELIRDVARVDPAATIAAARTALARRRYDIVLLDLGLPDGSGWDLLPVIQALEPSPAVIIFSATAVGPEDSRRVEASLVKTGTSEQDLLRTLRRVLTPAGREPHD